ncbi:MAG: enoyl-[acyl-carrier-protein] reductase FabK [Desulfobacteraceae bacterium]|nr:MAG: enoyl-[acyl-carrier-protein] reductase FabK [Desulfobacteraceae bacterium]
MTNTVCKLLQIEFPILLGGMLYAGRARLAAAVSEAGGLGVLGAGSMKPDELAEEVAIVRKLTAKPFGVNIPLRAPQPEVLIDAALAGAVQVFATSGGSPSKYTDRIKKAGAKIIHVVATVRQAINAQAAGVDAVVAEGCESGGILSKDLVTTLALVPQVVDAVQVPVIAAGGIADGRGMAAAFALGARAIQMGTRFLASAECAIAADYKQALLMAADTDTRVFTNASGVGMRSLKKELLQCAGEAIALGNAVGAAPADRTNHGRAAGQSSGLIHDILPAGEIIQRILSQAKAAAAGLVQHFG